MSNHTAIYHIRIALQYSKYWHSEALMLYGFMQQVLCNIQIRNIICV